MPGPHRDDKSKTKQKLCVFRQNQNIFKTILFFPTNCSCFEKQSRVPSGVGKHQKVLVLLLFLRTLSNVCGRVFKTTNRQYFLSGFRGQYQFGYL